MEKEKVVKAGKTELYEDDLLYGIRSPRPSCKFCHGTGREAWKENGEPLLCRCLKRNSDKQDWITAKQFQDLCKRRNNEGFVNTSRTDEIHTPESTI